MNLFSAVEFHVISAAFSLVLKCYATFIKAGGLLTLASQSKHYLSISSNSAILSDPLCSYVSQPSTSPFNSALLSNLVNKNPNKLTEWPHLSPLSFHCIVSLPSVSQRPRWGYLYSCPVSGYPDSWQCHRADSHTVPRGWLYFAILCSHSHYIFFASPFSCSCWCCVSSASVSLYVMLLTTSSWFTRDTFPSAPHLTSWSLILLKVFKLSVKY